MLFRFLCIFLFNSQDLWRSKCLNVRIVQLFDWLEVFSSCCHAIRTYMRHSESRSNFPFTGSKCRGWKMIFPIVINVRFWIHNVLMRQTLGAIKKENNIKWISAFTVQGVHNGKFGLKLKYFKKCFLFLFAYLWLFAWGSNANGKC